MLAESEIGDWIKIIVLVLVFGGSVFGSVAKALIKHFGGDAGKENGSPNAPRQRPAASSTPIPPVARPMAPFPQRQPRAPRRITAREPIEPKLGRPVVSGTRTESVPGAPRRRQPQPPPIVSVPGIGSSQTRQPQRIRQGVKHQTRKQEKSKRAPKPTAGGEHGGALSERHLTSELASHHLQLSDGLAHPETEDAYIEERESIADPIHRPTKATLRRAVILSEIIGKPLALRIDEQSPWE